MAVIILKFNTFFQSVAKKNLGQKQSIQSRVYTLMGACEHECKIKEKFTKIGHNCYKKINGDSFHIFCKNN